MRAYRLFAICVACLALACPVLSVTAGELTSFPATHILYHNSFDADAAQWAIDGTTMQFKQKLTAPVLVEFEATPIDTDSTQARSVTCFWTDAAGEKHSAAYALKPNVRAVIRVEVRDDRICFVQDDRVVSTVANTHSEGWFTLDTGNSEIRLSRFRVYRLADKPHSDAELVESYIRQAGNTDDESLRISILKELRACSGLDSSLKKQLDSLIPELEKWNNPPELMYYRFGIWDDLRYDHFGVPDDSPLFPLTRLYHARMIVQNANEYGTIWGVPEERRKYMDAAREHFEAVLKEFPANRLAAMYLGEKQPAPRVYPAPAGAPEWAVYQRRALEGLADVVEWWIDNRQKADGSYGGGWEDDCEMWRSWVPVLTCFDDPEIVQAQARLSKAIQEQPHMKGGYTSNVFDVEHTAEETADTLTPMMLMEPENEYWSKKALKLTGLMESLWMDANERGMLQFKSTYFSCDKVDEDPKKACDTPYHTRAMQPVLLYWQRTGDPRLGKLITRWMDTWVAATKSDENGKPAGVIPSAIHWPEGKIGGLSGEWWDPRNHDEPALYQWPSAMDGMTHALLLTYYMTGNEKYLEPLRSMAQMRREYTRDKENKPEPGTREWCAQRMGFMVPTLAKYTLLTGSNDFTDLIKSDKAPYMAFRLNGGREALTSALKSAAGSLSIDFEGYTSEVRYTDRVFVFPRLSGKDGLTAKPVPGSAMPDTGLLYSTLTGDPGSPGYFPINAVRWLTPPRDIAALVTDSGTKSFKAELYHFGTQPRKMAAEFYLLDPGEYEFTLTAPGSDQPVIKRTVRVEGKRTQVEFELPARMAVDLLITPAT